MPSRHSVSLDDWPVCRFGIEYSLVLFPLPSPVRLITGDTEHQPSIGGSDDLYRAQQAAGCCLPGALQRPLLLFGRVRVFGVCARQIMGQTNILPAVADETEEADRFQEASSLHADAVGKPTEHRN